MKENLRTVLIVLALLLVGNDAIGQKRKPKWDDAKGLQCINCGDYITQHKFECWRGKNMVYIWGPCPSCGKFCRKIGNDTKNYWVEPILDARSKEKLHKSSNECYSGKAPQTGKIKSVEITNHCPFHETIYIILRGKSIKDEVYLIEWGKTWIKNVDLDKYHSKIEIYHKQEIPDGIIKVGNDFR